MLEKTTVTSPDIEDLNGLFKTLSDAQTIPAIKRIRDQAEGIRIRARSVGKPLEVQNLAAEIRLRAERKMGTMLREEHLRGGDRRSKAHNAIRKLGDLHITKSQSSRWQLESAYPDVNFERYIARCVDFRKEISSAELHRLARNHLSLNGLTAHQDGCSQLRRITTSLERMIAKGSRFGCIFACPPWPDDYSYGKAMNNSRQLTMVRMMATFPVSRVTSENSHLHLLAPAEQLPIALGLMDTWGFQYRSVLALRQRPRFSPFWPMGFKFLLFAMRGTHAFRNNGLCASFHGDAVLSETSCEELRQLLEQVSPGPYLDIFGEIRAEGWTVLKLIG